ncbi:ATP-binding cassette domain-containing protein, partial [Enterococcus faecium]|nr:ATP-binding cassette domain-containing protein [Enterococcus faecium]
RKKLKLLNIENISKNYGDKAILENVSCEIESGEIIGLLGLNGQGKSTFVKIILDLLNKDSGHIDRFLSLKKKSRCDVAGSFFTGTFKSERVD